MENPPHELFKGCKDDKERAARLGRWAILKEMGFFGDNTNAKLAAGKYEGTFVVAVRRKFSNVYGDAGGCDAGDIEVAAEYLDVFDDVFDVEVSQKSKFIKDK